MGELIKILIKFGLPFIFKWLMNRMDKDKARQKKKDKALKEVSDGIKKKDSSKIVSGFDRVNRIR